MSHVHSNTTESIGSAWAPPNPRVVVRQAGHDEFGAIGDVLDRAYDTSYGIDDDYRDELHHLERFDGLADVWAARIDDDLVGALITPAAGQPSNYVVDPPVPEIGFRMLGVDPAGRGKGVAKALIAHVIELGRERGAQRVGIYSAEHMLQAHAMYRRLGFVRQPWRDSHIPGSDVPLFAFVLDIPEEQK
ncbi:hypothetical protein GCM10009785_22460 [Brooklawnia cerclae]|uniref:Glutathione S-transferase n=1 Tax=Brooklawnia cerclae TaxID=349934 RepID=A0ABX0SJ84_9ACTN|nr:GNAT family N-acetyltransferase [Brooklawnia cerclae]NIH57120.1 putative glutathione S-transferase [Brooklawnia cerclae]